MDIEKEIESMFIEMAEKKQDFLIDSSFLVKELVRKGYQAPFDQLQDVADRIFTNLQGHPEIQAIPLHNGLSPKL